MNVVLVDTHVASAVEHVLTPLRCTAPSPRTSHALETQQSSSSGQADSLGITKRAEEPSQQGHGPHLESTPFREEAQVLLCWVTSGQHQTDAAWRFVAQCREELAARFSTSVATITDPW